MSKPILLLFFALAANLAHAQDFRQGYIIKANGDSIAGFVAYRSDRKNEQSCHFKLTETGEKVMYLPGDLQAYGLVNDRRYETKTIPGDTVRGKIFSQAIIKGALGLYGYSGGYFVENDSIILLQGAAKAVVIEGKTYMTPGNRYIGMLNFIMRDCGLTADRVRYTEHDLAGLVEKYNRCKGITGTTYKSTLPWTKYGFSAFGGVDWSTIKMQEFEGFHFNSSQSAIVGVGLHVSAPRLNDKFFVTLEAWYQKRAFQGSLNDYVIGSTIVRTIENMRATYLKVPFGLKYNFSDAAHTFCLTGGFSSYSRLSSTGQLTYESTTSGVVTTMTYDRPAAWRSEWGVWAGVGYSQRVYRQMSWFAELRGESVKGYNGPNLNSSGGTINLIVGVRWN